MRFANVLSQHLVTYFAETNDHNALMELYNRHHDQLFNWISARYGVDRSIAENVVVETLEQVRDRCREYDETKSFSEWLLTLAGNCVAPVTKRIKRQRKRVRAVIAVLDRTVAA